MPDFYGSPALSGENYSQQPQFESPTPKSNNGFKFTVVPDDDEPSGGVLTNPDPSSTRRKRTKKESAEVTTTATDGIIRAEGEVEDTSAIYSYGQTSMALNETVHQLDNLTDEIKSEMDQIKNNRTLKRKYDYYIGLANSMSQILSSKVGALREINSCISKANDLDYKRAKDRRDAEGGANDDRYIMDMYSSFIQNPMQNQNQATILGPSAIQSTLGSSNIIRSNIAPTVDNGGVADAGYLNYISNVSPEQNMMFYESNPNVKTVVVFDASTGNKFFQVMDVSTGQVVPNVPVLDNRFMEDTTLDVRNGIAKNNNLNQTYPIITINNNVTKEY